MTFTRKLSYAKSKDVVPIIKKIMSKRGDVIMSIDQQPAKTPQQAAAELKQAAGKGTILLLLNRHGTSQFVGLSVTPGVGGGRPD